MENKYYFTFGSDPLYPYDRNDYVVVEAADIGKAIALFQLVHPNRPNSGCVNCAAYYSEEEFNTFREKYYPGIFPKEIISLRIQKN